MQSRTSFVLSLFLLLFIVLPAAAQDGWQVYSSDVYGFTATFPGTPEETLQSVPNKAGTLELTMISYDASKTPSAQNMLYAVAYSDYSTLGVRVRSKEEQVQMLDGAVNGMVTNVQGELLSEEDIELAGMPGREIRVGMNDNNHMIVSRLYLVNDIVYVLMVITTTEKDNNPLLTRFINSFALLPRTASSAPKAAPAARKQTSIPTEEPSCTVELRVDGQTYTLREGEPLQLDGTFKKPTVTARVADTRTFTLGSLSFEYPQQFLYEYEEGDNLHTWTLDGGDITIMLFYFPGNGSAESTLDGFVTSMKDGFDTEPAISSIEKKFSGKTIRGKRLSIETGNSHVHYDAFALDTDTGVVLLGFNSALDDNDEPSEKSNRAQALVARTIRY